MEREGEGGRGREREGEGGREGRKERDREKEIDLLKETSYLFR